MHVTVGHVMCMMASCACMMTNNYCACMMAYRACILHDCILCMYDGILSYSHSLAPYNMQPKWWSLVGHLFSGWSSFPPFENMWMPTYTLTRNSHQTWNGGTRWWPPGMVVPDGGLLEWSVHPSSSQGWVPRQPNYLRCIRRLGLWSLPWQPVVSNAVGSPYHPIAHYYKRTSPYHNCNCHLGP